MNLDKFLGIFAFVIVGMLTLAVILDFAEGNYFLGVIRIMLIVFECRFGWRDLKRGFGKEW